MNASAFFFDYLERVPKDSWPYVVMYCSQIYSSGGKQLYPTFRIGIFGME